MERSLSPELLPPAPWGRPGRPRLREAARRVEQRARGLVVHRSPAAAGAQARAVRGCQAEDAAALARVVQKSSP